MYEQLFERTIEICGLFPSMTPLSIRQERAEEVITMIARFITLSRRRKAEEGGAGITGRPSDKTVTTRSGSRIIIKPYEDTSGLVFGG